MALTKNIRNKQIVTKFWDTKESVSPVSPVNTAGERFKSAKKNSVKLSWISLWDTPTDANKAVINLWGIPKQENAEALEVIDEVNNDVDVQEPIAPINEKQIVTNFEDNKNLKEEEIKPTEEKKQDINTQEIEKQNLENKKTEFDIESQKKEQENVKNKEVLANFQNLVENGANLEDLREVVNSNQNLRSEFNTIIKNKFKNKSNLEYFNRYSSMSNEEMYNSFTNGDLVIWDSQYNLLNESQRKEFENYKKLAEAKDISKRQDLTQSSTLNFNDMLTEVRSLFSTNLQAKANNLLNNPQIQNAREEAGKIAEEINGIDDTLEQLDEDLRKSLTWVPKSIIEAEIANRSRWLYRKKQTLQWSYNTKIALLSDLKSDTRYEIELLKYDDVNNQKAYNTALSLYQNERGRMDAIKLREFESQNRQIAEQKAFERTLFLKEYEQKLKDDNKSGGKYEVDRNWRLLYLHNWEASLVQDSMWDVVFTEDKQETNYKDTVNFKDGVYYTQRVYKDWKMEHFTSDIRWNTDKNMAVMGALSFLPSEWLQCWEAVNRYIKTHFPDSDFWAWNTYESKARYIQEWQEPIEGWVAIWNPWNVKLASWKDAWHVGIISKVHPETWEVTITDWNWWGDEKKDTRRVKISEIVNSDGGFYIPNSVTKEPDNFDITVFNNSTFKPQNIKDPKEEKRYRAFLEKKDEIMSDPNTSIQDILKYSAWGSNLTDTSVKALEKFDSALNQITSIQEQISNMQTWPIIWKLRNINPYDVDAQTLKASLTALIPNLARWVYGEVWVLTDNDIRLYSQTIPNLTSTQEVNEAILWMTLKVVAGGYKRQLQSLAASWKDVSWFAGLYENLLWNVEAIETRLGINNWNQDNVKQVNNTSQWGLVDEYNKHTQYNTNWLSYNQ